MATDKHTIRINFCHKLSYKDEFDEYTLQMCHRRNYWWLLLLLLPLLLFIPCRKDVVVDCIEADNDLPIEDQPVTMMYESHYLWNEGEILPIDSIYLTQKTDSVGRTVFRDLPCSVFSYLFYCLSEMAFTVKDQCHAVINEKRNFHYTRHVKLEMKTRREDLYVKLLDLESGDVLPDGIVIYEYIEQGKEKIDTVHADATGTAILTQIPYCSNIKWVKGSCYGYADTVRVDVPFRNLVVADDRTALQLRPIKNHFTFLVKNKETSQPIPDALAKVSLTRPRSSVPSQQRQVRTSIDGKGIAVYENAFVLSTIAVEASKIHYRDGRLEGGPWIVNQFVEQEDDIRTIWLVPEPYLVEFVNIDSVTGRPIPGVKNVIKITGSDGKTDSVIEISNQNGVFPVTAKEDSRIEIMATKSPVYKPKHQLILKFKDKEKVVMEPDLVTIQFRTIRKEKGSLLPDCRLYVTGSESDLIAPDNSGDGTFSVSMRKNERLSIVALKEGYIANDFTVRGASLNELSSSPFRRDIPLEMDLPPCQGGVNIPKGKDEMHHQRSYGMGQEEGDADFVCDFYNQFDYLTIYDGPDTTGSILTNGGEPRMPVANEHTIPFHFTKGAVTVVIETFDGNSSWTYIVTCPH